ncbi:delta-sarcoglycan-like [Asterias amurensis]|uniref:delta-sarcoglycan-like n=1 Tax=Asterias amurensis TaxID=7602 RepID=UPI003AB1C642
MASYSNITPGTSRHHRHQETVYKVGIYGWRKRCLYLLILVLTSVIIVNVALTVWILRVMNFTMSGIGKLQFTKTGIKIGGEAEFLKTLYASEIKSKADKNLVLQSATNVTINARNGLENTTKGRLIIGPKHLVSYNERFVIYDTKDKMLFYADENEVIIGAKKVTFTGSEGTAFEGPVQTPLVTSVPGQDLRLESLTSNLVIESPQSVSLSSPIGQVSLSCFNDINLHSRQGKISLDAASIAMKNLPESAPGSSNNADVFELCACQNGRLFLAPPTSGCRATADFCD